MIKYSVLQTVYKNDNPKWLEESIESMLNQTVKPFEYLILVDGPVPDETKSILDNYACKYVNLIKVIYYEVNRGLGPVLNDGVNMANCEYIARMDSDDIANSNRCEEELKMFETDPSLDIVGSNINEFIEKIDNVISKRLLPEKHGNILKFSKERNPFNHPSVMFKKNSVLKAGNYRTYHLCEDYDLWVRMIMTGSKTYNIQNILLNMRTSLDFYKRRSGFKYLKAILKLKKEFYKKKYISFGTYVKLIVKHSILCLSPNFVRKFIYKNMLRGKSV